MGLSCTAQAAIAVRNFASQDGGRTGIGGGGGVLESFKLKELEAATSSFARENEIGRASHGVLYCAALRDGRVVAVKYPDGDQQDADQAFRNEAQILSKLFSRRLVNLLGYCAHKHVARATSSTFGQILVLEHMENGTLHSNLVPGRSHGHDSAPGALSWPVRVKLALDVAKAIRALHASSPSIVHRNLRATNIFIDHDGNARLSDFCLAKCLSHSDPPRRSATALISIPETSPDHGRHFDPDHCSLDDSSSSSSSSSVSDPRGNPKVDVFSFGVILLEIISGRSAAQDHHVSALRLLDWALPLIKHGHATAICDPTMICPVPDTAAVELIASVAARCVRSTAIRRPSMDQVVQSLTKARKLITVQDPSAMTSSPRLHPKLLSSTPTPPPNSGRSERLIRSSTVRSSLWTTIFTRLKKKRRMFVYRLSRFLGQKLRLAPRGLMIRPVYGKLDPAPKRRVLINYSASRGSVVTTSIIPQVKAAGAKVSDVEGFRERSVVEHILHHKKSVLANGRESYHRFKLRRAPSGSSVRFAASSPKSHNRRSYKPIKFVRL